MSEKTYKLELNQYQRDNLLWLLEVSHSLGLDTGDWHGEITWMLLPETGPGVPNRSYPATIAAPTDVFLAVMAWLNETRK